MLCPASYTCLCCLGPDHHLEQAYRNVLCNNHMVNPPYPYHGNTNSSVDITIKSKRHQPQHIRPNHFLIKYGQNAL